MLEWLQNAYLCINAILPFNIGGKTVKRYKKIICLLLLVLVVAQVAVLPVRARVNSMLRDTMALPYQPVCVSDETEQLIEEQMEKVAVEESAEETAEETTAQETVPEETEPTTYDEVPLYFQTDYPDVMYANDTLATSGCSMASLAMVATYMTDHKFTPDQFANWFGGYIGNHRERLEYASQQLQLPYEEAITVHDALKAVKEGKVVIALMSQNSLFTNTQHFVVFSGMTVDGKILVNDPYEPNYTNWQLSVGFENGFEENQVTWGFGGGWIYDKSLMPSEPFIYEPEERPYVECRYPDVELSEEDLRLFAKLLWLECRGESYEGQQAVAEVILNRLVSPDFPDTIRGIVYADGQFPCTDDIPTATPTQTQYEAIENALKGPYILPMEVIFYAKFKENRNFWGQIGDHYFCYGYDWKAGK
jgi:hypothetical protein